jgi:hypothetical protein
MKLATIRNAITSRAGRQILKVQGASPTLLFGVGVVGVVTAAVLASRATLKLDEVLEEHQEILEKINLAENIEGYSEKDQKHDKMVLLARTSGKIMKLYLPSVAVGLLSICSLTGSHIILTRRNVALTAAYAALDKGFRDYRDRVIAEYGKDKDDEYRYGYELREFAEDTPEGVVVKAVKVAKDASVHARFFDETCADWQRTWEYNRFFLQAKQNYLNNLLQSRGHVFLNEVYDALGMERSRAGAVLGWILGKGNKNYIDFGIFDGSNERARAFVNGWEGAILIDFNIDEGTIFDKIKE